MQNLNSIFIFAFLFIVSCNRQYNDANFQTTNTDTPKIFTREIPTYKDGPKKGDTTYLFKAIREDVRQLNLDNIENGYDSLEIRIWLGHSMAKKRNVVIIQRKSNKWSGKLVTFIQGYEEKTGKEFIGNKEVKEAKPKSGWNNFIKNILSLKIMILPDENDISGYNGCGTDGLPYYFEIATRDKYRFFTYCNIEDNIQNFAEARYVDNIARLLEKELIFEFTR
ncbi:MAG: hypothetical protein SFU87_16770 [Chitinophagaceae bacterium]|nr:hypothetical protein [Chitinophagaceae bacterium]